ncbi:MAG: regulator of sigma protease [Chloroflexota bacterium]|nr:regulator of sigma protease [Chloroflexota bacterium]
MLQYLAIVPILVFLMVAHEFGHFITAKKSGIVVEEFAIGFPPRLLSTVRGGVRYSLNLIPLGAYVKMLGEEDPTAPGSFASQSRWVRAMVLVAGAAMNFIVAVLIFALAYGTGAPEVQSYDVQIASIVQGTPAADAGLQAGDVVRSVAGKPVTTLEELQKSIQQELGQTVPVQIERDGQPMTIQVTPRANPPDGQGPLGIGIRATNVISAPVQHNPIQSLGYGLQTATDIVRLTLAAPVMIFQGKLAPEAARPVGLPGMTQVAGQAAAQAVQSGWWFPILMIAGLISAGLAVTNLLPIPALDGGRLLFVLIEAIRGRRISPEREGVIHLVGMVFLLSIMLLVSYYDIVAPPPGINWSLR